MYELAKMASAAYILLYFYLDMEPGPALLVTVTDAAIMCCSSGSFVSSGQFNNFCLHLSDNFDHVQDEWTMKDGDMMNTCAYIIKYIVVYCFILFRYGT